MSKPRKKVYMSAGNNTISLGTGRKEFHPKKPRPGLEHYIKESALGTLEQIGGGKNVDESVIGNFMAARFNKQANLPGFVPMIDPDLMWKPAISVEGACASGALAPRLSEGSSNASGVLAFGSGREGSRGENYRFGGETSLLVRVRSWPFWAKF